MSIAALASSVSPPRNPAQNFGPCISAPNSIGAAHIAENRIPTSRRSALCRDSANCSATTLEDCEILTETPAVRELIRAASQLFWKEVNTLEKEKPARGGPCSNRHKAGNLYVLQRRDSQNSALPSSENLVFANGLICADFRLLWRVPPTPKGASMSN